MKSLIATLVVLGALTFVPSASAQYVTYYSAPTVVTRVYSAPVTTFYAPAQVVTYRSIVSPVYSPVMVYRAEVPVVSVPAPVVYRRPVYAYYSGYGGLEVRVPGQPIRNTIRAIVP